MVTRVFGAALSGMEPFLVTVESGLERGLPRFDIVGLAQSSIREGRSRVLSALSSVGVVVGAKRITVNLAPAAVRKDGSALDLPIALGLLGGLGVVPEASLGDVLAAGELALDGSIRPVRGSVVFAELARETGSRTVVLPHACSGEALQVGGIAVSGPRHLSELIAWLRGEGCCPEPSMSSSEDPCEFPLDWSDVAGQLMAKRAMEIAAAGGHNVLLAGPPGIGKTLLARRLPSILPPLDEVSAREVRRVHSVAGLPGRLSAPYRDPHHSVSIAGMIGGGRPFRPGELTLAHHGVLFLDELPEFRRDIIEALREPIETGFIHVVRCEERLRLPARFLLVGTMNLCPCGALGDAKKTCLCPPPAVERYRRRVSGPIRDRMDIVIEMSRPTWGEVWGGGSRERSEAVRRRVTAARERQAARFKTPSVLNVRIAPPEIIKVARPDAAGEQLLAAASEKAGLSTRAIHKVLVVARTIADLEGSPGVLGSHVAEALAYRFTRQAGF